MKSVTSILMISLVWVMLASPALASTIGDVDRAVGNPGTYRLVTGETSGVIITLPDGLRDLWRVEGGYTVRANEKRISSDQVGKWANAFCFNLGLSSSVQIADGRGPRSRQVFISCR